MKSSLTKSRNYYKPFSYPWAYDAFMASEQMHWLWTEVPMIEDIKDWKNVLTDGLRSSVSLHKVTLTSALLTSIPTCPFFRRQRSA